MKFIFTGAGVIGSIIAAKLSKSGHNVTVLARGQRLNEILSHGIVLRNGVTGHITEAQVNLVEKLNPDDYYDLAVVPVRADQLTYILPVLAANRRIPDLLIMANNPKGPGELIKALGPKRFLLGFPGMGGGKDDHVIVYDITKPIIQPTTFGELDGRSTPRLREIVSTFKKAGFPATTEKNMDAWQKTHICWVSPFANAIYMAGGDNYKLANRPDIIHLMILSIREAFSVLGELNIPVTPSKFNFIKLLPLSLQIKLWQKILNMKSTEILASLHCKNAPQEMKFLSDELLSLARNTVMQTPSLVRLAEIYNRE